MKLWVNLDSSVSDNTLTTADGILNVTHVVKQECDDCLWDELQTLEEPMNL